MGKRRNVQRKRRTHQGIPIIACVVLIFCVVLMYNSVRLNQKLKENQEIVAELEEELEEQKEIQAALEEKQKYMTSEEYIMELAREKLGLASEDDIIFKKETK